jgi:hypothetical protein
VTTTTVLVTPPASSATTVPPSTTVPASFDVPTLTTPCPEDPEITLAQVEAQGITPTDLAEAAQPNTLIGSSESSMVETTCQGIAATMPVPCKYSTTNDYGQIVQLPYPLPLPPWDYVTLIETGTCPDNPAYVGENS